MARIIIVQKVQSYKLLFSSMRNCTTYTNV